MQLLNPEQLLLLNEQQTQQQYLTVLGWWVLPICSAVDSLMRSWQEAQCALDLIKWAYFGLLKHYLRTRALRLGTAWLQKQRPRLTGGGGVFLKSSKSGFFPVTVSRYDIRTQWHFNGCGFNSEVCQCSHWRSSVPSRGPPCSHSLVHNDISPHWQSPSACWPSSGCSALLCQAEQF